MFVYMSVCLLTCVHDDSKSNEQGLSEKHVDRA